MCFRAHIFEKDKCYTQCIYIHACTHHGFLFQVYKQKVKHLLYEHQNNISELKAESVCAIKLAQDDHRSNETDLRKDKRALKVDLKEKELSHEDYIKNLKKV